MTRIPGVALARALCILAVLLSVVLWVGCGESENTTRTTVTAATGGTLGEEQQVAKQVQQAKSGSADSQDPATFISLCANCHDQLDRPLDWRQQRKLVFNHAAHFKNNIRCAACHESFPHKPGRTDHVPVETCFQCHGSIHGAGGVLAPTECDSCHTADIAKITPDHNSPDWLFVPGDALALHSQKGKERPLYCKMCHEGTFCQDCHKVEMPHPSDWVSSGHQPVARQSKASCQACHPEKNFCNDCHHTAFPRLNDWGAEHKSVVTERGAELCYTCHRPPFCSACHVQLGKQRGVYKGLETTLTPSTEATGSVSTGG